MSNRAFGSEPPRKKDDNHGGSSFTRHTVSPKAVNVYMTFEQALRLSLSLQSCLLQLNTYKRSTTEGRRKGMCITAFFDTKGIGVTEANVEAGAEPASAAE